MARILSLILAISLLFCSNSYAVVAKGVSAGFVTSAPTSDPGGLGYYLFRNTAWANKDTSPAAGGLVTQMGYFIYGPRNGYPTDYELCIYNHNAVDNLPNIILNQVNGTTSGSSADRWITESVNYTLAGSTTYWIEAQYDNDGDSTGSMEAQNIAGERSSKNTAADTSPDPWVSSSAGASLAAIYALYTDIPAGGGRRRIGFIN